MKITKYVIALVVSQIALFACSIPSPVEYETDDFKPSAPPVNGGNLKRADIDLLSSLSVCDGEPIVSISFANTKNGALVCLTGQIQVSNDSGKTWNKLSRPPAVRDFRPVKILTRRVGEVLLLVNTFGKRELHNSAIWRTSIESRSWERIYETELEVELRDFDRSHNGQIIAIGPNIQVSNTDGVDFRTLIPNEDLDRKRKETLFASVDVSAPGEIGLLEYRSRYYYSSPNYGRNWSQFDIPRTADRLAQPVPPFRILNNGKKDFWITFVRGAMADEGTISIVTKSTSGHVSFSHSLSSVEIKDIRKVLPNAVIAVGLREDTGRKPGEWEGVLFLIDSRKNSVTEASFPKKMKELVSIAVLESNTFVVGDSEGFLHRLTF